MYRKAVYRCVREALASIVRNEGVRAFELPIIDCVPVFATPEPSGMFFYSHDLVTIR